MYRLPNLFIIYIGYEYNRCMRVVLFWVVQCTWGCVQSFIGFVLYIINRKEDHSIYHGSIVTKWNRKDCVSLGLFIFVSKNTVNNDFLNRLKVHEFGHCIQSLLLGPLYLIVIGIPSYIWNNLPYFIHRRMDRNISYYSFWIERWANYMGEITTKENSMKGY